MAWGRKKSGGRKEPQFGLAAALGELRLSPQDRVAGGDDKPKKSAKRKSSDDDDEHSPGSGNPPDLFVSEPLAPVIFAQGKAWVTKARPAGQVVQHPPCAAPQTGPPPAHATA